MLKKQVTRLMRKLVAQREAQAEPLTTAFKNEMDEAHLALLEGYELLHEKFRKENAAADFDAYLENEGRARLKEAIEKLPNAAVPASEKIAVPSMVKLKQALLRIEQELLLHGLKSLATWQMR